MDNLCQHLAENPNQRKKWADLMEEFRWWQKFPEHGVFTSEDLEYMRVFTEAIETDRQHDKDEGHRPITEILIGAVPEGFVYYLLDNHTDSKGHAQREVHVEIDSNGNIWRSNSPNRPLVRSLDVAFWDNQQNKGRGFECKIGKVQVSKVKDKKICDAVIDLLACIYERTSGCFETVLFSFCEPTDAVINSLFQNLEDQSNRDRLNSNIIKFVGYEHLAVFDGTTSCCGGTSRGFLPDSPMSRLPR
ncbi:hypothetical protein GH141_08650 [bacterium]|nr:hypothetical protein [bacterium]